MFSRFELLIGEEKLQQLQNSHVLVFGVGGVGGGVGVGVGVVWCCCCCLVFLVLVLVGGVCGVCGGGSVSGGHHGLPCALP